MELKYAEMDEWVEFCVLLIAPLMELKSVYRNLVKIV